MYKQYFDETYDANTPENYERFFVPFIGKPMAEDLVEQANLQAGEKVLDVACGTGIVARLASSKVGPEGSVSGLDASAGMLTVARSVDRSIKWYEANAEAIPMSEDAFDVVFCQMGLQFMEKKTVALQEMRRVLQPGGRLLFNVPGPAADIFSMMADAVKKYIGGQAAGLITRVFSLYDPGEIKSYMLQTGFRDIRIETYSKELRLPKAEEFLWQYIYSTPLITIVSNADEASHLALENEMVKRWKDFTKNGTIRYAQPMVTVFAYK